VEDYIALESLRLGERLAVERAIGCDPTRMQIPVMVVQTLVENAVKHGIARLPQGGSLRISAHTTGGKHAIEVENPRPPAAARRHEDEETSRVGLANARQRLRLLCGPDATIDLDLSNPDWAVARVSIPA
jgi:sensor histidine kinase YesM